MPGRLVTVLFSRFKNWDRSSQIALVTALILIVLDVGVLVLGPADLRQPALIGLIGLVVVTQVIFMWANRGMVTVMTRAQRHFLNGELETAAQLLEAQQQAGKADFRALTLLGNTYRQLGQLAESEAIFQEVLSTRPNHHFPLYGFGRTLLVMGRYEEAAAAFEQALATGAPAIVYLDLGETYYRQGETVRALDALDSVTVTNEEPYRDLMLQYLGYQLGRGRMPEPDLIEAGLPYWQAAAERFHHTAYGQQLAEDIYSMESMQER